jgi:hypothetical protein
MARGSLKGEYDWGKDLKVERSRKRTQREICDEIRQAVAERTDREIAQEYPEIFTSEGAAAPATAPLQFPVRGVKDFLWTPRQQLRPT